MKMETDIIDLRNVRLKLAIWGSWYRKMFSWGLGYSNQSLLSHLIKDGGMIVKSTKKTLAPENREAEEMNEWVEALGREKPNLAKVLVVHYVEESSVNNKINRTGFSKRTYFNYLHQAEEWILSKIY